MGCFFSHPMIQAHLFFRSCFKAKQFTRQNIDELLPVLIQISGGIDNQGP
jgi:hypothetical protein